MENSEINKLGKKLEIYTSIDYIGKGFPIILPNGAKIIKILRDYVEDEEEKNGFLVVRTPSISKAEIYEIEDRLGLNKNNIFTLKSKNEDEQEKNTLVLKPYSQPFHCSIFNTKQHTYKELPIKFSETSTVFRNEKDLNGIMKSRQFTLSDGSMFSSKEMFDEDLKQMLIMQGNIIKRLGLQVDYSISNWNYEEKENYIGRIDEWKDTVDSMKEALDDLSIKYTEDKNARLYGPSINIKYNDRNISTIQIDFEIVHRFDTKFVNRDNEFEYPIYTHINTIGSYENILSILIEKYEGDFPFWIAPSQVTIISEGEEFDDYANEVRNTIVEEDIRVNIDNSPNNFQNKIYRAVDLKIPFIITIGKNEYKNKTINVRRKDEIKEVNINDFLKEVMDCQK